MIINALPTDVNYFSSTQAGAPQMMGRGTGDLLKVLDTCLINGSEAKTVGVVSIETDIVTFEYAIGHGYLKNQILEVEGATNPQLNGKHRIKNITSTSVSFDIAGVIDEAGVITTKIPSLGWESIFGDVNPLKRAYRSKSSQSAKRVLFLDMTVDAGAGYHATYPPQIAKVSVCADMQVIGDQIGSITNEVNNFSVNKAGSIFWYQKRPASKGDATNNEPSPWVVVGNKDFFYIMINWNDWGVFKNTNFRDIYGFGEFQSAAPDTQEKTFLIAVTSPNDSITSVFQGITGARFDASTAGNAVGTKAYVFTPAVSQGFAPQVIAPMLVESNAVTYTSGRNGVPYPSAYGGGVFSQTLKIYDKSKNVVGVLPTVLFIENNMAGVSDLEVFGDVLCVTMQAWSTNSVIPATIGFFVGG